MQVYAAKKFKNFNSLWFPKFVLIAMVYFLKET